MNTDECWLWFAGHGLRMQIKLFIGSQRMDKEGEDNQTWHGDGCVWKTLGLTQKS